MPMPTDEVRVFHLIKSLGRGGAEMLLPETLRFADRSTFAYSYGYFLPWKSAMVETLEAQDVSVICFRAGSSASILLAARRVAEHLRRWRADVVHCHLPLAGAVGRIAGRLAGVPVVYTEHNRLERYHTLTRSLNRSTWRWQARAIAVSDAVASSIRANVGTSVRVDVITNGVDVARFDPARFDGIDTRARFGIPADAPVIGTVAVMRVQKRLDDWLAAARLIRARRPDTQFLIVGDGPLRERIVSLRDAYGLGGCLHFTGLQQEVAPFLRAMDIYMMSSAVEGLPVALLEAMAMGCAVISTAVGGIPEVIQGGVDGVLVAPRQPASLASAACALLDDRATMARYGAAARATVASRFSLARMSRQLEEVYLDVVRGGRS